MRHLRTTNCRTLAIQSGEATAAATNRTGGDKRYVRSSSRRSRAFSRTRISARRSTAPMHRFSSQKTGPSRAGRATVDRRQADNGGHRGVGRRSWKTRAQHGPTRTFRRVVRARHSTRVRSTREGGFALFNSHRWAEKRPACCGVVPVLATRNDGADVVSECRNAAHRRKGRRSGFHAPEDASSSSPCIGRHVLVLLENDELPKGVFATLDVRAWRATYTDRRDMSGPLRRASSQTRLE